jgi:hypothetical protein
MWLGTDLVPMMGGIELTGREREREMEREGERLFVRDECLIVTTFF